MPTKLQNGLIKNLVDEENYKNKDEEKRSKSTSKLKAEAKPETMQNGIGINVGLAISGVSGRFPESDNLHEFWENLLNSVDMITEDDRRWTPGLNGLPTRSGKIKELDKFDAQFFGVHPKQAEFMDPQLRILLEVTHEAIIDAGVNPVEIRGSRTGVFVGASSSECEKIWYRNDEAKHGYALTGCNRGMFSNRISFSFDFHGPSFTVDTACSSSFIALEQAVASIRLGHCDAAIVAGSNICIEPNMSLQFHRLCMLSPDGKCKSFDASGNGYVRSEAVVAIFIQKKDVALRSYASILAARTNSDGHKEKGVTFPSGERQAQLLQETYREAGVDPRDVAYVEAHGTGTQAGDPQELNAIAEVFCQNREGEKPLLIGSVKSNAGHAEPASGLMSMAKVLLSMQKGILPANLHYKTPNLNIPALCDGRLKVVSENTPWNGGIVGMNSFGFGGANVHIILKSNSKKTPNPEKTSSIPFLVPFSGRTKDAVEFALKEITTDISSSNHLPQQLQKVSLLQKIACSKIPGHTPRGHIVISPDFKTVDMEIQENKGANPPAWFIFNGMGSQWPKMGRHLLKFPVFENSIKNSAAILKPHGIDLISVLINDDETALTDSVVKSFVAITSVQVALVDLLRSLQVTPTGGIIGHSVGELAASYADNCFTASQTVLAALARGKAIMESAGNLGEEFAMAAVGLSWEEAKTRCPPGIYPACHNAKDSVTISGPKRDIDIFVQNLKNEGIFAKEVNSSKMAFHSKYIEPARAQLKFLMDEIIPAPHPRSARWISSSIPENEWNSPLAQFSSTDYHVNNLLSPVLFQESLQKIPEGAVVIEIGPHALLQAILKRSLPNCTNVGLVNKNHLDNSFFLIQALGKLYNSGLSLNVGALYPAVEFPVAVDTPSISPLIKWDHSLSWDVPRFPENDSLNPTILSNSNFGEMVMEISLNEESQKFYADHKIDGRIIFPATGYLFLIWKAFASLQKKHFEQVPIVLENVSILRATVLPLDGASVKFHINIFPGSGEFQLQESGAVIVNGVVRSPNPNPNENEFLKLAPSLNLNLNLDESRIPLSKSDAYKELRLRGYEYSGPFRGIQILDTESGQGKIKWRKNWVSFLDTVLQMAILHKNTRALYLPTHLDKAVFDPAAFLQCLKQQKEEQEMISLDDDEDDDENEELLEQQVPIFFHPDLNVVTCEGIQFQRMKAGMAPRRSTDSNLLRLEKFEFTPYFDKTNSNSLENSLAVCLDIVLENIPENKLKMLEILGNVENSRESFVISQLAHTHILNQPTKLCDGKVIVLGQGSKVTEDLKNTGIKVTLSTIENEAELIQKISKSVDLVITDETRIITTSNSNGLALKNQGFLLYHKNKQNSTEVELDLKTLEDSLGLFLVAHKISSTRHFYLFKKSLDNFHGNDNNAHQKLIDVIEINSNQQSSLSHFNYSWVETLKMAMQKAVDLKKEPNFRIYLISKEDKTESGQNIPSGVLGLVNSLKKEPGGDKIRCFFLRDSPEVSRNLDFLKPSKTLSVILQRDLVMNVFDKNAWGSMRFYSIQNEVKMTKNVDHSYLNVMTRGDLSSFKWFESNLKYHEPQSEICTVYYAPLNFRDVMLCTGKLALDSLPNNLGTKECVLGLEWSGKTTDGTRVMGVVQACGLSTSVVPDKEFLWDVPKTWTLAEASTVPVAYVTAYYALVVRGKILRGESILIHAGAGGVGMAAIRIALSMDCTVYTTVGSQEKKESLMKTFPQLKKSSFANSRDSSFLEHILEETRGRGVDLVLNSLAGDKLQASIKCLAIKGRFLEIGKVDLFKNSSLGMSVLLKNVSVHGILVDGLKDGNPEKLQVQKLVENGINSGVVKPLNSTIFTDSLDDVEKAFRFMASGKHIGKIMIEIRKENEILQNSPKIVQALPKTHFDPRKCYVVIGGLGGFGLEFCGWLIERGATKLALVSRSGVRNGYQDGCLRKWRKQDGATIITPTTDITTLEGVTTLFQESTSKLMAPIGGVFNLAMVLADGPMQNQTPETFQSVSRPKISSTIFLDQVSRTLVPSLEYFVVFSSVASGRGAVCLSNYAWANSGMERICELRQKDGLPGLAVMWGAIGDVGVLQDDLSMGNGAVIAGTSAQRISSCLNTLDVLLQQSKHNRWPVLSSHVIEEKTKGNMNKRREKGPQSSGTDSNLSDKIGHILGIKPAALSKVNPRMKLFEMGMDSLMSVEIKQLVELTTGVMMNSVDMLELTFEKISQLQTQNLPGEIKVCVEDDTENEQKEETDENEEDSTKVHPEAQNPTDFPEHTITPETSFIPATSVIPVTSLTSLISLTSLKGVFNHGTSILISLAVGILFLLSLIIRLGVKLYSKLFHDPNDLKLMDRPSDQVTAANPRVSNMIFNFRFAGVPLKSKIIKMVNERLINFKTSMSFESKSVPEYEPYELLRWSICKGFFYHYWKKDHFFNVADHVVFEKCGSASQLEEATLRASEFYHNYKWDSSNGRQKQRQRHKPQWEFRIISPKYPVNFPAEEKEFMIVFVMDHSYSDALSILHMVQYAWSDVQPSTSANYEFQTLPPTSTTKVEPEEEKDMCSDKLGKIILTLRNLIEGAKYGISVNITLIRSLTQSRRATRDHTHFCRVPDSKRHAGLARYSLSRVKSVVTKDGASVPVLSVVLTCMSKVYQRIYAEHEQALKNQQGSGKDNLKGLKRAPKSELIFLPYANRPYNKLGLENNFSHSYTPIPLGGSQETNTYQDHRGAEEEERTRVVQRSVEESSTPENLNATWIFTKWASLLAQPFDQLAYALLPSPSIVYTNVPVTMPRHLTFFGGYKIKDFFGFTMLLRQAHATLASAIDSATDTVCLSLIVDDSALETCPEFIQRFFTLFQEELDHLVDG